MLTIEYWTQDKKNAMDLHGMMPMMFGDWLIINPVLSSKSKPK